MSKFAFHCIGIPGWLRTVLGLADFEWIKYTFPPEADPFPEYHLKAIGRVYIPDGETQAMIDRGRAGAEEWYARVRPYMMARRWVWVWELPNEPYVQTREACIHLAEFTVRAFELMHADGSRVATGVFSRGTPELAAYGSPCYLEELAPVFMVGDYLALHQYGPAPMWADAPYLALRHRQLLVELRAMGIAPKPALITEGGIDSPGGYRKFGLSEDGYWWQLKWADEEYSQDAAVLCFAPFSVGVTHDWAEFEITEGLGRRMAGQIAANPPRPSIPEAEERRVGLDPNVPRKRGQVQV